MDRIIIGIIMILVCLLFPILGHSTEKQDAICGTTVKIINLVDQIGYDHFHTVLSNDKILAIIVTATESKESSIVLITKPDTACIWEPKYDKDYDDYTKGLITEDMLHAKRIAFLTRWAIDEAVKYHTSI